MLTVNSNFSSTKILFKLKLDLEYVKVFLWSSKIIFVRKNWNKLVIKY